MQQRPLVIHPFWAESHRGGVSTSKPVRIYHITLSCSQPVLAIEGFSRGRRVERQCSRLP